jgi:hypothetical protein
LAISFVALLPQLHLKAENVSPELAERAYFHAANLLKEFPPDKHYVIGLGRSSPVIASAVRTLIGDINLADRYIVEIPVQNYVGWSQFSHPKTHSKFFEWLIPPKEVVREREGVFLRVLDHGVTAGDFARDLARARAEGKEKPEAQNLQSTFHGYFIHDFGAYEKAVTPELRQGINGKIITLEDPTIQRPIVQRKARHLSTDPGTHGRFLPFEPSLPVESKKYRLTENPKWRALDETMKAFARELNVPKVSADTMKALREIKTSSLYNHYAAPADDCAPLTQVK